MIEAARIRPATTLAPPRSQSRRVVNSNEFKLVLVLSALHLPLGIVLYNAGQLAMIHPILAFLVAGRWAAKKEVSITQVMLGIGYMMGSEVLWRMAQIPIFWEFGKYGTAFIMVLGIARRTHSKIPMLPILYFLALMPAGVLSFIELDTSWARGALSSNLSGPLLLTISCCFFANIRLSVVQLRQFFISIIVPLLSVACVALFYTVSVEEINFNGESNVATSGGFGPNQVSSMLGLGAFICLFMLILFQVKLRQKLYFAVAALLFAAQSVMTFSRGGMYNAIIAVLAVSVFLMRRPGDAFRRLLPLSIPIVLFLAILFPAMNTFTGGALQDRFEDTGTTQRTEIADTDLKIFYENPVFGAGVGVAFFYREKYLGVNAVSHTEFTRLLAEHGLFGVVALICLLTMVVSNFLGTPYAFRRALIIGTSVWCSMFMLNAGMRLAAPSVMWGLMFLTVSVTSMPRPVTLPNR